MSAHLAIIPILLPLAAAALQLLAGARRRRVVTAISIASCLLLLVAAAALLTRAAHGQTLVYALGDWPRPFAIVLVVDRLAALMLLLTAALALAVLPYALGRWQYVGVQFQPLMQWLLLGFNGVFLTGDLFNLFVFFEVLLAASYGLALHGSSARRVSAGLHYIAINLAASLVFLLGVSMIYGATGTLGMAALAALLPTLSGTPLALVHTGAALLAIAFLVKTAIWPLGFWLPRTYAAATPPVAALFALMTKLGIYVLLRLGLLLFGPEAGVASAGLGRLPLLGAGMATLVVGAIGMLGARELGKVAGYYVLISSGTLLGAIALQQPLVTAGALAYLVISALTIAAFFLLDGLIVPREEPEGVEQLEPYDPAGEALYEREDESRIVAPVPVVLLAASFFLCAILLVGLPPMSGFLAKFALLAPMAAAGPGALVLLGLIIAASLATLVTVTRAGVQIFWAAEDWVFPRVRKRESVALLALLAACLIPTFAADAPWRYLDATARQLHAAHEYVHAVLPGALEAQP